MKRFLLLMISPFLISTFGFASESNECPVNMNGTYKWSKNVGPFDEESVLVVGIEMDSACQNIQVTWARDLVDPPIKSTTTTYSLGEEVTVEKGYSNGQRGYSSTVLNISGEQEFTINLTYGLTYGQVGSEVEFYREDVLRLTDDGQLFVSTRNYSNRGDSADSTDEYLLDRVKTQK